MMKLLTIAKFAVVAALSAVGLKAASVKPTKMSAHERQLVAAVIILEADGEGQNGRQAVLNVIHNRAVKARTSYYKVVKQRLQFSCINGRSNTWAIMTASKSPNWRATLKMVDLSMKGKLADITGGATHYHTKSLGRTAWSRKMTLVATIKQHLFFKEA
jgi:spore germination cell wall hydrolase CwlJ-like protein